MGPFTSNAIVSLQKSHDPTGTDDLMFDQYDGLLSKIGSDCGSIAMIGAF
jgi:hypothetical protein